MTTEKHEQKSLFTAWLQEMGRRHVFRILAIYVAAGWGLTEIVQGVVSQVGGPEAISTFVTIAFIVGFPITLFLAWVFDADRHGVHRVPTRGKGQLIVSLALAVLLAASYGIYRYLPRGEPDSINEPLDEIVMAVLPFRNLSASDEFNFLGQAIAEDLLNGVALIPDIRVKATFSSFALAESSEEVSPEVFSDELGVNRLLDGTFRENNGNLRISARLVDTGTGDVVWTRMLSDSVKNIFQMQEQIAIDIASEFGLLHPASDRTTSRKIDPQVFRRYLQARETMVNPWQDTETAIAQIQNILDLVPDFPEALAWYGFLNTGMAWTTENRKAPFVKVGQAQIEKALQIDPNNSEAYANLALNVALQYRWKETRQYADKALEVAGSRPLNALYTLAYNNLGHFAKTRSIIEKAFEQDPLHPQKTRNMMAEYANDGQYEEALQLEQIIIQRGDRYQRYHLVEAYAEKGEMETAREIAELWGAQHGLPEGGGLAYLDARLTGRSEVFEQITDLALASGALPLGQAIWNHMAAGTPADKIFDLVEQAIPLGQFNQISLIHPRAGRYRQHPRWLEIFTGLGLVEYWQDVELPDFCLTESIRGLCE
jgi:TolB-like protein